MAEVVVGLLQLGLVGEAPALFLRSVLSVVARKRGKQSVDNCVIVHAIPFLF